MIVWIKMAKSFQRIIQCTTCMSIYFYRIKIFFRTKIPIKIHLIDRITLTISHFRTDNRYFSNTRYARINVSRTISSNNQTSLYGKFTLNRANIFFRKLQIQWV